MQQPEFNNVCHVYVDSEPHRGDWNMRADELLLEAAIERGQCSVRVYRWAEPTLSLGYFQTPNDIPSSLRSAGLPIVRRLSGGGTILHHHELTYACAVPAVHKVARNPQTLYDLAHDVIIQELAARGVQVQRRGTADHARAAEFLCFARSDAFDLVLAGSHKVVGSAQRRRKGAVLQHGSVVLRRSDLAPQFPGIEDLAGRLVSADDLGLALSIGLSARLAAQSVRTEWRCAETNCISVRANPAAPAPAREF
jgi:lipoate-protein ligase A